MPYYWVGRATAGGNDKDYFGTWENQNLAVRDASLSAHAVTATPHVPHQNKIAAQIIPFLVLGFWGMNTVICAGACYIAGHYQVFQA